MRVLKFNICFIIGKKYYFYNKCFLYFPVFQPRTDTAFFFDIYINFFDSFFITDIFEPGFGSSFFITSVKRFYFLNILSVDKSFFSFLFFNFFIDNFFIYNKEWFYVFYSFKKFNYIFCNPPYLSKIDLNFFYFNKIKEYKYSLISKNYGFFDLYFIIKKAYDCLFNNGFLILEHGYSQRFFIKKIMILIGFINIYTYNDLSKLNRITIGEK